VRIVDIPSAIEERSNVGDVREVKSDGGRAAERYTLDALDGSGTWWFDEDDVELIETLHTVEVEGRLHVVKHEDGSVRGKFDNSRDASELCRLLNEGNANED